MNKKKIALILGILGGLSGFGFSILFVISRIDKVEGVSPGTAFIATGAVVCAIIGLVGSTIVKRLPKRGAIMMLVGAVGGLIPLGLNYAIPATSFLIGGLLILLDKNLRSEKFVLQDGKKPPKHQGIYAALGIFIGFYICVIVAVMAMDAKVVWLPWQLVGSIIADVEYYKSYPAKVIPAYSELDSTLPVKGFVEERFVRALEFINREPKLKYLADLVVKYKIPIVMGKVEDFKGWENKAFYQPQCSKKGVGKVLVNPSQNWPEFDLAGTLVHELTHAYNAINKRDYYCTSKKYISNEMEAYKNNHIFMYQFNHLYFTDLQGSGRMDLRGNTMDYCEYMWIKNNKLYAENIDDVQLTPRPYEAMMCHILLLQ